MVGDREGDPLLALSVYGCFGMGHIHDATLCQLLLPCSAKTGGSRKTGRLT